jgi:hypothetical protein
MRRDSPFQCALPVLAAETIHAIVICLLSLLCFAVPSQASGPDLFSYQIQFPPTPTSAADAAKSLDERATRILASLACGSEVDYGRYPRSPTEAGEDSTAFLIAKFEWVTGHPDLQGNRHIKLNGQPVLAEQPCTFTRYFRPPDLCTFVETEQQCKDGNNKKDADAVAWRANLTQEIKAHFKDKFVDRWPNCAAFPPKVTVSVGLGAAPPIAAVGADIFRVDFQVPHNCLVAQINFSLERMSVIDQLGSSDVPCHVYLSGKTKGEWDVSVRNLTRLAYLNARNVLHQAPEIIHPDALKNLQEELLNADGGPADEKYALSDCGNKENSTGSSQDRVDEKDWTDEPFWQTIGDILWFLLKVIVVIVIIYVAAWLLVGAAVAGVVAALVGVAIAVASVIVSTHSVPETENHLLMINTSKYLKNQIIINEVPDSDGTNRYRKDQAAVKDWLMVKMQSVLKDDLIEYNSRPYNRYTTMAIQNIADFAEDDDLKMGAHIVLDYLHAKFVVGSQQGRRFLPFRRKRKVMADSIDVDAPINGLFDLISGGDHQIGLNLYYAGQLDQMRDDFVSFGVGGQDIFAVTSDYRPEDFVLDLAFDKSTPIFQRIHHTSVEIYSSGKGFLISAGGMTSDYAYTVYGFGGDDDKGVAMPTTLFLPKSAVDEPVDRNKPSASRTTLNELIRIDGERTAKPSDAPSYDQNACVWDGFACGLNIVIPPSSENDAAAGFTTANVLSAEGGPCLTTVASGADARWSFIDSRRCPAYRHAPRTFTVIYRQACPKGALHCEDNFGFFEVIDASFSANFAQFMAKVIADNPPGFFKIRFSVQGPEMSGTYISVRGQVIWCQAFQSYNRKPSIIAVEGVPQNDWSSWSFAEGGGSAQRVGVMTPITANGDGLVTIKNSRLSKTLELDFRDKDHPHRNLK